jgi:hypothetical protein
MHVQRRRHLIELSGDSSDFDTVRIMGAEAVVSME